MVLVIRNRDRKRNRGRRHTVSRIDAFLILVLESEEDGSFSSLFESTLEWLPLASKSFLLLCWTYGWPSEKLITVAREMAQSSLLYPLNSSHCTSHSHSLLLSLSLSTHLHYKLQPPIGKSH